MNRRDFLKACIGAVLAGVGAKIPTFTNRNAKVTFDLPEGAEFVPFTNGAGPGVTHHQVLRYDKGTYRLVFTHIHGNEIPIVPRTHDAVRDYSTPRPWDGLLGVPWVSRSG